MKHKLLTGSLSFTVGMGFSALPAVAQQSPASTEVKPNVIIINVDDLGYGDIGCYGATKVKTPNIDRLASQGRSFMDAHSSSAVSTPSRYGLMTGQYPCREDIWGAIFLNQTLQIDTARTTIADVMKRSGYSTASWGSGILDSVRTKRWTGTRNWLPDHLNWDSIITSVCLFSTVIHLLFMWRTIMWWVMIPTTRL